MHAPTVKPRAALYAPGVGTRISRVSVATAMPTLTGAVARSIADANFSMAHGRVAEDAIVAANSTVHIHPVRHSLALGEPKLAKKVVKRPGRLMQKHHGKEICHGKRYERVAGPLW